MADLKTQFLARRRKIEREEKSDGSDVISSDGSEGLEDSEAEVSKYRPGGYFNPEGKHVLKDARGNKLFLGEKIGRGHFSTVYTCTNSNNETFAIKIQKSAKSYRTAAREEIMIHDYLSKPSQLNGREHVCIMLNSFNHSMSSGKHFCMVFPKYSMDVERYASAYEDYRVPLDVTSRIAHDVLSGLSFLHNTGFLHADLKPENLLVNMEKESHSFVITDLGTACVIGDREFSYLQTSHYRSPDIILQHKSWNEKIDVWSLACILYELITGRYLFSGETEGDYMTAFIETIGVPPYEYLMECKERRKYFDRNMRYGESSDLNPLSITRKLQERFSYDMQTANSIFAILQPMLVWDINERWSADDLLVLYQV